MESVPATFRKGQVELAKSVDWPDGTDLEVVLRSSYEGQVGSRPVEWSPQFFDQLRKEWGDAPFERPAQGGLEQREEW